MDTTKLQFNIVFTPDTAKYLSPFVTTFLNWTDWRFRMIVNGCPEEERQLLRDFCAGNE
ncbi:MAG: hypothetical protein QGG65_04100 [Gammaproteobacteria bacterium]|jgi:hypothetical protein|nr:hypothetical protein [Gammaproteobacteria bacterium]HJP05747.1 hypothetical protein [Gammaproteobacteria bacterium]